MILETNSSGGKRKKILLLTFISQPFIPPNKITCPLSCDGHEPMTEPNSINLRGSVEYNEF